MMSALQRQMHLSDLHSFLSVTDLLGGVPEDVLAAIRPQLRERFVSAGHTLFRDGDAAAAVYLIVSGVLRIEKDGIPLATRGAGECVGEFALMDAGVRSASAIAVTDTALLEWPNADAWRALGVSEELRHSVFRVLIGKLRQDVASQVTAALEREQLQQDLRRARDIQEAMLPLHDLETPDLVVSGISRPALDVGGDYFDAVAITPRTCSVVIADVAGHGLHAALLVAMAKTCFQTQVHADARTGRIVEALNRSLLHSVRGGMLMTCASATVDAGTGVLSYTNAGHPPPFHLRRAEGDVVPLAATDPLLGMEVFRDASFNEARTSWRSGDRLLMYSDGVSEARNEAGDEFGRARVEQSLRDSGNLPARLIRERLADEVLRFSGARPADDDMTIVVVEGK